MKPQSIYNRIVRDISKREGKKKSVSVGNVREIVGILSDMLNENVEVGVTLFKLGEERAKRKKK